MSLAFEIGSPAFKSDETIPVAYTCSGKDISPSLKWNDVPAGTAAFAIICDDPDAPGGSWVHWVIYNIPPHLDELLEAIPQEEKLKNGAVQGFNDFHRIGYNGPCPPSGRPHRYIFTIYALDMMLYFRGEVDKASLLKAMEGHILAQASLMGRYGR
ncbi:MAG: YbhB/YbcL family Raf kinase inhibitor-like protein [Candidatus Omnitrophota bacterium]